VGSYLRLFWALHFCSDEVEVLVVERLDLAILALLSSSARTPILDFFFVFVFINDEPSAFLYTC
jgi:hypothetical protein